MPRFLSPLTRLSSPRSSQSDCLTRTNRASSASAGALIAVAVALVSSVGISTPLRAEQTLNALVWCDHTDPELIEPFEKANDVKVNLKDYEGTGTALSIVEQSQPGDWDVVIFSLSW